MDLLALESFSIPTLEINGNADEESVADIFVRVNSGGEKLGEDDFILTLIPFIGRKEDKKYRSSAVTLKYRKWERHSTFYSNHRRLISFALR